MLLYRQMFAFTTYTMFHGNKTWISKSDLHVGLSFSIRIYFCPYTIFETLPFSKYHFSETPQEKYDHAILLQPISLKKCRMFLNRLTNKNIMPKNYFVYAFCMCKEGNSDTLKLKI